MAACIRAARAYIRADQDEVGRRLGVSGATVSAWERGKTRVPTIARPGVIEGLIDLGAPASIFDGREKG